MSKEQIANQRIFDAALQHIRSQGEPSFTQDSDRDEYDDGINCQYHGPNGKMCAFAPCIKNYESIFESKAANWFWIEDRLDALYEWAREADMDFCNKVQNCHDKNVEADEDFLIRFENDMENLANEYGMKYEPRTICGFPIVV